MLGVHELHVWQLSEAQTIASVHVVVPKTSEKSDIMDEKYMELASLIKNKLHLHGVHSTTVQPEFTNTIVDSNSIGEVRLLVVILTLFKRMGKLVCCNAHHVLVETRSAVQLTNHCPNFIIRLNALFYNSNYT